VIAKFFIERPILANVIALIILLIGAVAILGLPVSQYPQLTPPTVQVTTSFPGASAAIVQQMVAHPIEEQVNGVPGLLYMQSTQGNDGSYSLIVSFVVGTDPNQAQIDVESRVSAALPQLPQAVQQQGVVTKTKSTAILLIATLTSSDANQDALFLSNYASLHLKDRLARLPGVADVNVFGVGQYSMRIWLDANQMRQRGLNPADVISLVNAQSQPISLGQLGAPPAPPGQDFQITLNMESPPNKVQEFGQLVVKSDSTGAVTRLRDVARIELGSQTYGQTFRVDGHPAAGIAIYLLPTANALATEQGVRQTLQTLSSGFPRGLSYSVPFDTTTFVRASITEVYHTLFEAGILVLIVIVVFLQDWGATLVPATTVPITIVGAFAAMAALGFSINLLTLFALVLCIGIVVDDAIVIVEGVSKYIEAGEEPHAAAIKAMQELVGPVIGITLVLMSVFLPAAFIPGITGQMYRQFALVIAATALISAINALTLKPTQSAKYIRPHAPNRRRNWFERGFDKVYNPLENRYARLITRLIEHRGASTVFALVLIVAAIFGLARLPTGFIPTEDQGYLIVAAQLPDAASLERTDAALQRVTETALKIPGVDHTIAIGGISPLDNSASLANAGMVYVVLKNWDSRAKGKGQDLPAIYRAFVSQMAKIESIRALVLVPPAIPGLGLSGGFQMQLELTDGSGDYKKLADAAQNFIAAAKRLPQVQQIFTPLRVEVPQFTLTINRAGAELLGVSVNDALSAIQSYLGSSYVNQISKFGQNYTVYVQADQNFRVSVERILELTVRSRGSQMVPLGSFVQTRRSTGPALLSQYQLYPTASINGASAAAYSSGEALDALDKLAAERLPSGVGYEWTAMSYQERLVGHSMLIVFGLAITLVYLVLAGQYESWWAPVPVLLAVPLALVGTVGVLTPLHIANNIYVQIGLVLLIALSAKNAILIVEVAQELRRENHSLVEAAAGASRRRFRPILMTSFAFILGVLPLVVASGAGASARKSIGITVFSGMLASTLFAIAFVPVFYVVIETWHEQRQRRRLATKSSASD
jgi:hydrophobic/amphiphilic exporter-1 (mainly G- bacteria), HAE1 family